MASSGAASAQASGAAGGNVPTSGFETNHEDMIHDAQLDYYGTRLATCSSDRTIKLFDVTDRNEVQLAELRAHEAPVWRVTWAHPKFGNLLASCSYDQKVFIWKETNNKWNRIHQYTGHTSSVNCVTWAPHELGLLLATASSDGSFTMLQHIKDDEWMADPKVPAHNMGCNAVSWAPPVEPAALLLGAPDVPLSKRVVTGGCDGKVAVWKREEAPEGGASGAGKWSRQADLEGHTDWVRDVAWAPNIGLPRDTIASCSQDGRVLIWTSEDGTHWNCTEALAKENTVCWRVSWSVAGNVLAVSTGDNEVILLKESPSGEWDVVTSLEEDPSSSSAGGGASSSS